MIALLLLRLYALWLRLVPYSWLDTEALRLDLRLCTLREKPWSFARRKRAMDRVYDRIGLVGMELTRRARKSAGRGRS